MEEKNVPAQILPERMDRFTWHEGELNFFECEEEFFKYAEKNNMKVITYEIENDRF